MSQLRTLPKDRRARIAVLDDYMGVKDSLADWTILSDRADVTFLHEPFGSEDEAVRILADFDAICLLRERTAMPATLLHRLPNLKAIAATGKRNRTLDDAAARQLGIAVMTTSGSGNGIYATVELAWGMIISLMRFIPEESAAMRAGAWQTRLGSALYGRTLGVVGLGKLGARMASIASAFGMKVIAWSPNLTPARAAEGGAEYADRATLFETADIISLHLVLGEKTRGIVTRSDLRSMKPDAILINTARGPLVEDGALLEALESNWIRGAGIDVYDREPLPADDPIRQQTKALLTPHLGYSVRETFESFHRETVENLDGWLNGNPKRLMNSGGN